MSSEYIPCCINCGSMAATVKRPEPTENELREAIFQRFPQGIPAYLLHDVERGLTLNDDDDDALPLPSADDYIGSQASESIRNRSAADALSPGGGAFDGPAYSDRWTPPSVFMDDAEEEMYAENDRRMSKPSGPATPYPMLD